MEIFGLNEIFFTCRTYAFASKLLKHNLRN